MFPFRLIGLVLWLFWPLVAGSWTNVWIGGWWPFVAFPAEAGWLFLLIISSSWFHSARVAAGRRALGIK
jgi:hypothetical protein